MILFFAEEALAVVVGAVVVGATVVTSVVGAAVSAVSFFRFRKPLPLKQIEALPELNKIFVFSNCFLLVRLMPGLYYCTGVLHLAPDCSKTGFNDLTMSSVPSIGDYINDIPFLENPVRTWFYHRRMLLFIK